MAIARAAGNAFIQNTAFVQHVQFPIGISAGGSLLVAAGFCFTSGLSLSLSDDQNGAWTTAKTASHSALGITAIIGYFFNSVSGVNPTVTLGGGTSTDVIIITEYTGVQFSSDPINGTPNAQQLSAGSSIPDSGAINTTSTGLVVGAGILYPTDTGAGSPFTEGANGGATYKWSVIDALSLAAGANDAVWGANCTYWMALGAGFSQAGGAAAPYNPFFPTPQLGPTLAQ